MFRCLFTVSQCSVVFQPQCESNVGFRRCRIKGVSEINSCESIPENWEVKISALFSLQQSD